MDRCHRIGQHKPVLVLRLATAHSVEGRMLKRARSKLALERLVIKKGAFLHQQVCKVPLSQRVHVCLCSATKCKQVDNVPCTECQQASQHSCTTWGASGRIGEAGCAGTG